ncbi:LCP family protein [Actinomycetospora endophytica]|uniref:LCP family protein n=1 Tax=Actinomycetospora endophytica TaxID=2291215 RepID=A0ABS8PIW2_9PSEU|nr:LCP family protein [Actinomycetospora endophytica]MCD2197435.1 LCP family protein [Actinomycetospora endophytica]
MKDERGRPPRDPGRRFGPSAGRGAEPAAAPNGPPAARGPGEAPGADEARGRRGTVGFRDGPPPEGAARGGGPPPEPQAPPREPKAPPREPKAPPRDAKAPPRDPKAPPRDAKAPPRDPKAPPRDAKAPAGAAGKRPDGARPNGAAPTRPAPARPVPPPRPGGPPAPPSGDGPKPGRGRRILRIVAVVASVLVFAMSGTAWAALSGSFSSSGALSKKGTAADGATDILLVGTDSRTDAQGNPLPRDVLNQLDAGSADGELNTDTMMLVRVPNDGSRAVAFSLPRDSFVKLPGQTGKGKLNSVYPAAKAAAQQQLAASGDSNPADVDVKSSEAGRQSLIEAVQDLTGIGVDHYAEVNLLGFSNLTNAIGGVDVCLKNPVDDDFSGAHFAAGPRTVQGKDALAFVRQRHGLPLGDLDRVRRQQAFLAGLSHKILSAGTLADPITLTKLLDAVKQSVILDNGWDLLGLAQQMQGVSGGSVSFMTIPTQGGENTSSGDALKVDPVEVQRFVADAIGPKPAPTAATPSGPAPGTIPVDVRNASGTEGAAGRVVQILGAQGYTHVTSGNADQHTDASSIVFGPGGDAAAGVVAKTLGGLTTKPDPTVPPNTVRVLLASDYKGPGAVAPQPTGDSQDSAPPPPSQPPITADGVPCVN